MFESVWNARLRAARSTSLKRKGILCAFNALIDLQEFVSCKQVEKLLKENGIGLPPTPPEPPHACLDDIPTGARMPDPAVAAGLSANIASGLVACSTIMGQSIREDVAMMFGQFHMQKAQMGAKVLKLNKEKGWLIPPPLHKNKNEHCE